MNRIIPSIVFFLLFGASLLQAQAFQGKVLDGSNNQPLGYVDIYFPQFEEGVTTDENGIFTTNHVGQKKIQIQISSLGYETIDSLVTIGEEMPIFLLNPSNFELKEVVISASTGKLEGENVVSIAHQKLETLQRLAPLTLAETISNISGVEQNTTGNGIGKPVIRGLSGNRIVTYAQGIRVENQQWGDEHGLGVGENGIGSVEVIKGPASLLYGSDALGGVIYFVDAPYAKHNTYEVSAQTKFLSNSLTTINDLGFKIHKNKLKFNLFGAYSSSADFKLANGKTVDNTRFDERNIKGALGYNTSSWVSNIRYSFLQNHFGIAEDAAYSHSSDRNFVLPFQVINNHSLSFENNFFFDNDARITTVFGYTSNYRREFEDNTQNQALGLILNTFSYNLKWNSRKYHDFFSFVVGTQGMKQTNTNNGEDILIPNATTKDIGVLGLMNFDFSKTHLQTGIRFDNRDITTTITGDIPALQRAYQGVTFSAGGVRKMDNIKLRANVSSGFRAPNTSELLSDGVHEGTNRYEKGNNHLANEQATQVDLAFDYRNEHLEFSVNPFYNYIKNYIFLSPTDQIIDGNVVFDYLQSNAYLYGGEMGVHYHPHQFHWLHLESTFATVLAEKTNKDPLPLIPQNKISSTVRAELDKGNKLKLTSIYLQNIYKFKQDRVGNFETTTKAYSLLNFGASLEIASGKQPIQLTLGAKNLLNADYVDHLSRFKKLGIPNAGINFYVGAKWNLSGKVK